MTRSTRYLAYIFLLLCLVALACGGTGVPADVQQTAAAVGAGASDLAATGQAIAEDPSTQATAQAAVDLAYDVASTAQAMAQDPNAQATAQAAVNMAATVASDTAGQASVALATLEAAGIDEDYLRAKMASIQPDENGNITVTITDEEVNAVLLLQQTQAAAADLMQSVQGLHVTFTGGNIVISGTVTQPIPGDLIVTILPVLVNGVVEFQIVSASLAGVEVPAMLLEGAQASLNNSLGQALASMPANVTITGIVMGEGTMTLTATTNP